jgi:hypothetical protein
MDTPMPKAYDTDFEQESLIADRHRAQPPQLRLAENILSALYVLSIASFNAGYFERLKGQFVQLFSFADLIGSNIAILQYIFGVLFFYTLLTFYLAILPGNAATELREWAVRTWDGIDNWKIQYQIMFVIVGLAGPAILSSVLEDISFSLALLPTALIQGVFLLSIWTNYKNGSVALNRLLLWTGIVAATFSYTSGRLWVASEISEPKAQQSIVMTNGQCLDRRILRTNSSGYLLYNFTMRQAEFRNKDDVRTVFQSKACT